MKDMQETIELIRHAMASPKVDINLGNSAQAAALYRECSARHPTIPIFRRKTFGAALLDLADRDRVAMVGHKFKLARYNCRKAVSQGFSFHSFDPLEHLDEMLAIHASAPERQGRQMAAAYLDKEAVRSFARTEPLSYGVFDRANVLVAYAHTPIFQDVFVYSRILGHAASSEAGVVYLLVHETNKVMAERWQANGFPRWAWYDMFLGARSGLRFFKSRCGFEPRRVKWTLTVGARTVPP